RIDLGLDLLDEAGLHFAGALVDADGAGFSALADDLPRAGGELFLDVLHPAGGRDDARAVLAADLGEDGEVPREALDVLELLRARDVDHAVRHLDVLEAVVLQEGDVLGDLLLHDGELEETATAADVDVVAAEGLELRVEVLDDHRRGPAELDDVDVVGRHLAHALDLGDGHALVEDLRDAALAGLALAVRDAEERP